MKVAISATGNTLDAEVDPRFGRCSTFLLVETEDMSHEALENDSRSRGGGAGVQTARWLAHKGAKAVLTGNCGPNAHQTLSAAGISVFVGCSGVISELVAQFEAGLLRPAVAPNVANRAGAEEPGQ